MTLYKHCLRLLCLMATLFALQACGGGGEANDWDAFQPRAATAGDLATRQFVFTDFDFGAVFDASLNRTTTTLAFSEQRAASATAATFDFSLSTGAGAATGTALFEADQLTLTVRTLDPGLPFRTDTPLRFRVLADVEDGRISLTNLVSGVEATSAK
jgi:hypothetical protein